MSVAVEDRPAQKVVGGRRREPGRVKSRREVRRDLYREFLRTDLWQDLARRCKERDGMKCVKCGQADLGLQAHHLEYPKVWDETRLEQLQALCKKCHSEAHRIRWIPLPSEAFNRATWKLWCEVVGTFEGGGKVASHEEIVAVARLMEWEPFVASGNYNRTDVEFEWKLLAVLLRTNAESRAPKLEGRSLHWSTYPRWKEISVKLWHWSFFTASSIIKELINERGY